MDKRSYRPFLLASGVLLLTVFGLYFSIRRATGGVFVYPIDATFIHMVVARTVALQGNWGISGHEFESASSSILYTLLLAGVFKGFSVHFFMPLAVDLVARILLLAGVRSALVEERGCRGRRAVADPGVGSRADAIAGPDHRGNGAYAAMSVLFS